MASTTIKTIDITGNMAASLIWDKHKGFVAELFYINNVVTTDNPPVPTTEQVNTYGNIYIGTALNRFNSQVKLWIVNYR